MSWPEVGLPSSEPQLAVDNADLTEVKAFLHLKGGGMKKKIQGGGEFASDYRSEEVDGPDWKPFLPF